MKKDRRKSLIIVILCVVILFIIAGIIFLCLSDKTYNTSNVNNNLNQEMELTNNSNAEIDESFVKKLLSSYKDDIGNLENLFFESNYNNDYRFIQKYKELQVYGGGIIATVKDNEIFSIINYTFEIPEDFNINPINNKDDLLDVAKDYLNNNEVVPKNTSLIIYPLTNTKFTLAYLYEFNGEEIIVNDKDKAILVASDIFSETSINTSVSNIDKEKFEEYKDDKKEAMELAQKYLTSDNEYVLEDKERNIKFYRIKDKYDEFKNSDQLKNKTNYYDTIIWKKDIDKYDEEYLAIKTMSHLQNIYDYYKKEFGFVSLKQNEPYNLRIFTNFTMVQTGFAKYDDYRDNAVLVYFDRDDMRIYLGSYNYCNDDLEVLAHEYTHGYFRSITNSYNSLPQSKAINEAYSDIMGMIIEAYYGDGKIDGIFGKREPRVIKDSNLKYTNYSENTEYHENSMIVSKVAYLMSINDKLNMSINDLAKLWFNSIYKLPQYEMNFDNVEKAILIEARELGYSVDEIREIANIFVSLEYPDYFEECYQKKMVKYYMKENSGILEIGEAENILYRELGEWRGIKCNFEYVQTLSDENGNLYYIFDRYAEENFINYGGEGLTEEQSKGFYAGSYYVSNAYYKNRTYVGWARFREDDKLSVFIDYYYFNTEE